jgi:hypothetical protein
MTKSPADYLKNILIILFSLGIVWYIIFNFRIFIAGPEIIINSPQNGSNVSTQLLEITGKAHNTSFINLNDKPIFLDEQSNFRELLLLSPGYNIIIIKAKDKFEREISKKLEVVFEGDYIDRQDIFEIENSLSTSTDSGTSTFENNGATSSQENLE